MPEHDSDPQAEARARAREDAIWRDIVAHYGDTPEVPEEPPAQPFGMSAPAPLPPPPDPEPHMEYDPATDEERFVPGDPGPHPRPTPPKAIAWAGVAVVPLVLLVCVVSGWAPPQWADVLLLAWFVGGFGYLVATMSRGEDRDEYDDGARL